MLEISKCPICSSSHLTPGVHLSVSQPMAAIDIEGLALTMAAVVTYAVCQSCGVYIQTPRMDNEQIGRYYTEGHYRRWLGADESRLDADELRRAKTDAEFVRDHIGPVKSHLDTGASRGYFLDVVGAADRVAIEANREWYTGNGKLYGCLEDYSGPLVQLASAIHVLEHTTDPMAFLRDLSHVAREWLMVEVPSDRSPGGWARLPHLFHFPPWTLRYMFDSIGWEIDTLLFTPHTLVIAKRKQ